MEKLFTLPKKMITLGALFFVFACSSDNTTNDDLQSDAYFRLFTF